MISPFPCFSSSHFRVNTVRSLTDEQQEPCRKEEHSRSKEFFLPTKRAVSFWATQFPTLTLAEKALYCFQRSLFPCKESALLFSAVTFPTGKTGFSPVKLIFVKQFKNWVLLYYYKRKVETVSCRMSTIGCLYDKSSPVWLFPSFRWKLSFSKKKFFFDKNLIFFEKIEISAKLPK